MKNLRIHNSYLKAQVSEQFSARTNINNFCTSNSKFAYAEILICMILKVGVVQVTCNMFPIVLSAPFSLDIVFATTFTDSASWLRRITGDVRIRTQGPQYLHSSYSTFAQINLTAYNCISNCYVSPSRPK